MDKTWIKLTATKSAIEASMIEAQLKEEDIDVVVVNKQNSAYITIGEIDIMVPHNQVIIAKRILEQVDR